jgi:hypothetical protein
MTDSCKLLAWAGAVTLASYALAAAVLLTGGCTISQPSTPRIVPAPPSPSPPPQVPAPRPCPGPGPCPKEV